MLDRNGNEKKKTEAIDIAKYMYFIVILGVYPIFLSSQRYFNITITKYRFFIISSVVFLALCFLAALLNKFKVTEKPIAEIKLPWYKDCKFFMLVFLMSNFCAVIVSKDFENAIYGTDGRYMGFFTYLMIAAVFLMVADYSQVRFMPIMLAFAFSSSVSFIIAIMQHTGKDFLGLKEGISPKQYDIFISTFGNINMFASFLAVSVSAFLAMFIFTKKILYKLVASIVMVLGGMSLMIANSDSGYAGTAVAIVVLFFLALYFYRICDFFWGITILALGNYLSVIFNRTFVDNYKMRGGVAQALDNVFVSVALLCFILVVSVLMTIVWKLKKDAILKWDRKIIMCSFGVLLLIGICVATYIGVKKKLSLFTFDYKWGTYRGYIWTKVVELYKDAPIKTKLFGFGNESVKYYMKEYFYNEMIGNTGRVYDNAHNELLQYLFTTGIFGCLSYIGLFITSFVFMIKKAAYVVKTSWESMKTREMVDVRLACYEKQTEIMICLAATTGYFAQGIINLNQPITTPLYFVILAIGVSMAKNVDLEEKVE